MITSNYTGRKEMTSGIEAWLDGRLIIVIEMSKMVILKNKYYFKYF